jgi:hypothetical protein
MGKLNESVKCLDPTWLQVQATAIVIGDNLALLGLASNPIVIHVDEDSGYDNANTDWRGSDYNTEIVTAPEFWEVLIYESFPDSADEHAKLMVLKSLVQWKCKQFKQSSNDGSRESGHLSSSPHTQPS